MCKTGAGVAEPLMLGIPVTRHDVNNMLGATIIPFLFGYVAPIRPTMLLTLQHPHYKVRSCTFHCLMVNPFATSADHQACSPGPMHSRELQRSSHLPWEQHVY